MELDELRAAFKAEKPNLSPEDVDRLCRDHLTSEIRDMEARLESVERALQGAASEKERDRREEEQAELRLAVNDLRNALDQLGSGKA